MPKMHCHPAKTQLGLFFFIYFYAKKKKWTFCRYCFTWQVKVSKTTRCVHVQTQTPKQRSLNWNSNNTELANIQTYLVISPSTPLPPSFLSLSVSCSSEAADLLCSGSLRRLMVESLSTHCPISISKAGTDSYPSGRENCIYILMST